MPKKTRKQKQLSDQRKQNMISAFSFRAKPTSAVRVDQSTQTLLVKDLRKTLLLGGIFIAFEIILALFSQKLGW